VERCHVCSNDERGGLTEILSPSDVASWYTATLVERGHQIMIGTFGHVPTAVSGMIKDGIDGVLILTDDDDNLQEIAARFTRATGRPVWRNLTDIPPTLPGNKRSMAKE
jgi:hypothetical protein